MKKQHAFTLVELLVVIAIIAILVSLLLPAVNAAREAARRTQCINRMRQLGLAIHNFHSANRNLPNIEYDWETTNSNRINEYSWRVNLMPYMELQSLHDEFDFDVNFYNFMRQSQNQGSGVGNTVIADFTCPSDPTAAAVYWFQSSGFNSPLTDYFACSGTWEPIGPPRTRTKWDGFFVTNNKGQAAKNNQEGSRGLLQIGFKHVQDGLSKTIAVGERGLATDAYWGWTFGPSNRTDAFLDGRVGLLPGKPDRNHEDHFWSFHPGGATFLYGDAHVEFLSYETDVTEFDSLLSRDNGTGLARER